MSGQVEARASGRRRTRARRPRRISRRRSPRCGRRRRGAAWWPAPSSAAVATPGAGSSARRTSTTRARPERPDGRCAAGWIGREARGRGGRRRGRVVHRRPRIAAVGVPDHRSPVRLELDARPRSPDAGNAMEATGGGYGGDRRLRRLGVLLAARGRARGQGRHARTAPPSDSIFLADVAGRRVAFLPRHGRRHTIPPHKINYRANVWAMRSLGVKAVDLAVRGRLAPARGQARRLRRVRPVRRPDARPRSTRSTTGRS